MHASLYAACSHVRMWGSVFAGLSLSFCVAITESWCNDSIYGSEVRSAEQYWNFIHWYNILVVILQYNYT